VTDDGGFLEPSPEIKALKAEPVYDFDLDNLPPVPPIPTATHPDLLGDGVTYVDLAHRAQPEGIESDEVYDENESYRRMELPVSATAAEKIVYATIKTEVPIKELLFEKEAETEIVKPPVTFIDDAERGYASPQKMLDPTRARLHDDNDIDEILNKKLPPEPPGERSETETEDEMEEPVIAVAKKIPPPIPELHSPLDLQDVEFADASDDDDSASNRKMSNASGQLPDAMTADEAEQLLSSR